MEQFDAMIQTGAISILVILAGMIKIPKLEINVWNLIGRAIGRSINREVMDRVNALAKEVDELKKEEELESYFNAGNWDEYKIRIHAVKSTSKMIGAAYLFEKANILMKF